MTATTQVTNIAHLLDLTPVVGTYAADYDIEAANAALVLEVNEIVEVDFGQGIRVYPNGDVIAYADLADRARAIDWRLLLGDIDVTEILADHDRSL